MGIKKAIETVKTYNQVRKTNAVTAKMLVDRTIYASNPKQAKAVLGLMKTYLNNGDAKEAEAYVRRNLKRNG